MDRQTDGWEGDGQMKQGAGIRSQSTGAILSALTSSKRHKRLLDFSAQTGEMTVVLYNHC